jgi:hypothetical protein
MIMIPYILVMQPPSVSRPKEERYPDMDAAVLHFIKETHAEGTQITRQALQVNATETANSLGITDFKTGQDWYNRFMCHEGLSSKQQTSVCRKIPADFQEKLLNFQRHLIQLWKKIWV